MAGESSKTRERLAAASALVGTVGTLGRATLQKALSAVKKSSPTGGAQGEARGTDDGEAVPAGDREAIGARIRRGLQSTLMFRTTVGVLVLIALVQWSLIFFNYWR
ncbi:MAG: hypothetical protein AAF899_15650 [Pseudomonadota bacterium]